MHISSGRWQFGLSLTILTTILWGALPIGLKALLPYMDSVTITWLRFLIAAILLGAYLKSKNRFPNIKILKEKHLGFLMLIAIAGLLGNYILYMVGLEYVTPEGAQVVIQLAPMFLLIGGLVFFKESFSLKQWIGLMTFLTGLILFFNQRFESLLNPGNGYTWGVILIVLAAIVWAAYALAQKQLLKNYASEQIMVLIYIAGAIIFMPLSEPAAVFSLDWIGWSLLAFCGANTLIAYGAFAEALEHWEASRVSATLAITPLFTLSFMQLTDYLYPGTIEGEPLNLVSIIGAILVVCGSAITALSKTKGGSTK